MRVWQPYRLHTDLFTSPNGFLLLCKVRNTPYLDLPTLININDEVHEPSNLLNEFSSVLIISLHFLCRYVHIKKGSGGLTILSSTV
jgi:hypothetical protein